MTIIDTLVFDRTQGDANFAAINRDNAALNKGAYNAADLNRVEAAVQYLNNLLVGYGYGQTLTVKTNWTETTNFFLADMNRIRNNAQALYNTFVALPEWKAIVVNASMDFEQANALEWNLHYIDIWLQRMIACFHFSGQFYSGEHVELVGVHYLKPLTMQDLNAMTMAQLNQMTMQVLTYRG